MGCGCKKRGAVIIPIDNLDADGNPDKWGSPLWTILHILAENIGRTGNALVDIDQARDMDILIQNLHLILPCETCQAHCRTYIKSNPFTAVTFLKGKSGTELNTYVRQWLLTFHNVVRASKGQPIEITSLDVLAEHYSSQTIQECMYNTLVAHVAFGNRNRLIKMDNWKRWLTIYKRLKVLVGA
jgi:hypothetical protein